MSIEKAMASTVSFRKFPTDNLTCESFISCLGSVRNLYYVSANNSLLRFGQITASKANVESNLRVTAAFDGEPACRCRETGYWILIRNESHPRHWL